MDFYVSRTVEIITMYDSVRFCLYEVLPGVDILDISGCSSQGNFSLP
jgi:hypothetical protein